MLILILNYLPLVLLALGVVLVLLRPLVLARRRPLTETARKHLWFWQAVGFWALVIGGFMIGEKVVPRFFESDATASAGDR